MGVVQVKERLPNGATDEGLARFDMSRTLLIQCEFASDDESEIYGSGRIPGYLSPHPKISRATLRKRTLRRHPTRESLWWECDLEYSTKPLEEREIQFATEADLNPLERRARVTLESSTEREFSEKGYLYAVGPGAFAEDESTILNSANEPFEPSAAHEIEVSRWIVNVEKNVDAWPLWLTDYENTINAQDFTFRERTFPIATLKMGRLRMSDIKVEGPHAFYTISFQLVYNRLTWDQEWLDQGFHQLDIDDPNKLKPIYVNGTRPSRPQLLDGTGYVATRDNEGVVTPVYRKYRRYPAKDFSVLPLY